MKGKLNIKQKKFQTNRRAFILMTVLCIGIGFAYLSSTLTITGNTSVSGNSWNVYLTNVQINEDSVDASIVPTTSGTNTTSIDYAVTLDKPGDFYEFTVDAVNNGTINAMIENIDMTSLDTDVEKYLTYTATYLDGTPLARQNVIEKEETVTYKIRVEYKKNISANDLSEDGINLTLTFGVNYVQSTLPPRPVESVFAKLVSSSALSDININFGNISSASNGRGLYVMHETTEDTYPIYYYRGKVTNNHAKFAGFCWRIVRTTETGGTKLVYNGTPDGNGQCVATGKATQLPQYYKFNPHFNSLAYAGYMYGTVYEAQGQKVNSSYMYGNTFTYTDGNYTLSNTRSGVDSTHHYTCFNTTGTCSELYYVYNLYSENSNVYYITLTNGKSIEDAIQEMQVNTNSSTIKTAVDGWFNDTFKTYFTNRDKDYNDYLEDTVWCNDRSMNTVGTDSTIIDNGWNPNGGNINNYLWFSTAGRRNTGTPSLECPNKNDAFTVNDKKRGNGALTYPVGLLTSDELIFAGAQSYSVSSTNNDIYLNNGSYWHLMSPLYILASNTYTIFLDGYLASNPTSQTWYVRPSISLKPGVQISEGGDGTAAFPYEFVVE